MKVKVIKIECEGSSCIVYDKNDKEITRRELGNAHKRFQVIFPFCERFVISGNCKVLNKRVLDTKYIDVELPKPEKNIQILPMRRRKIANWHSPASINASTGVLITNEAFENMSTAKQKFILAHEVGHNYYSTEKFCDLFASKALINEGFGFSQCLEVLRNTLSDSPEKKERYDFVHENLMKYDNDKGNY